MWFIISIPFIAYGIYKITKIAKTNREAIPILAVLGAFIFVLSSLKLPSVTGSTSHPTGTGLAAVVAGPVVASVLALFVLVFQALLLAHGGIITLGVNVFSMGIVGPIVAYALWKGCKGLGCKNSIGIFLAAVFGDLATYVVTSIQLALVFPNVNGVMGAFINFATIFAVTQIPIAIGEGILAVIVFDFLVKYKAPVLTKLKVIKIPGVKPAEEATEQ